MSAPGRFAFLDVVRAIAPMLVVYAHFVMGVPDRSSVHDVVGVIDAGLRVPLRLEMDLGHLAVVMFFLVSGFIVTEVAMRESHREFAVKRVLRIYPPLVVGVLATAAALVAFAPGAATVTPTTVLTNVTLVNYVLVPQVVLLGVAWTLVIEVIFYTLLLALMGVARRSVAALITIELALVLAVALLAKQFGAGFHLFAVSVSFLPALVAGQITWAVWRRRLPAWQAAVFVVATWALYVWLAGLDLGRINEAYASTLALSWLAFVALLLAEPVLRPARVVTVLADRSYSLYLMHWPALIIAFQGLGPDVPTAARIAVGLGLAAVFTEITHRVAERPGQALARRITRRWRRRPADARVAADARVGGGDTGHGGVPGGVPGGDTGRGVPGAGGSGRVSGGSARAGSSTGR